MLLAVQKDNLESAKWYDRHCTVMMDGPRGQFPLPNVLGCMALFPAPESAEALN
jgi:hypothetical protein